MIDGGAEARKRPNRLAGCVEAERENRAGLRGT